MPIVDAAIKKLVRLLGSFPVECADKTAQNKLTAFLEEVRVGGTGRGIDAFVPEFFDTMLTAGTAVGEAVFCGREPTHLFIAQSEDYSLLADKNPLSVKVCARTERGDFAPVKRPELIVVGVHDPRPGTPYGTSALEGLPFVGEVLMKIMRSIGNNWDRTGYVRYAVTYRPGPDDAFGGAYDGEKLRALAQEWKKTMDGSGAKDFVSMGNVDIKVIGADNQVLEAGVPVRLICEQIVAKLGIPPFMLGLSWNTSERMSKYQSDALTSEIEYYRKEVTPAIKRICTIFLESIGKNCEVGVIWDDVMLLDSTQLALAEYYNARAENMRGETNERNN